jgi:tetratricopeptide (TPR) repeat protein
MKKCMLNLLALAVTVAVAGTSWAKDGKVVLNIPLRGKLTPVQRLNREGVEAVKKLQYDKAEQLFYKAYLYDPADPFTLNNLGYVAEVQGQLDRAHKFYQLAAEQGSDANIDLSSTKELQGRPMKSALVDLNDATMRMNRMNLNAMRLLAQDRGFEAVAMLKQTLALDPQNPFTLNNLGVASEAVGDLQGAYRYYYAAANTHSSEPAAVTLDRTWRGKSVSSMAEASARRVHRMIDRSEPAGAQSVRLTVHGVYAANQNDWNAARQDFLRAYTLDPNSAFTLNNRAYVAEHDGDLETAQYFYEKARRAGDAGARVGIATRVTAQGQPLVVVAEGSNNKVDTALEEYSRQRRNQKGPIELTPRGNNPTDDNNKPQ